MRQIPDWAQSTSTWLTVLAIWGGFTAPSRYVEAEPLCELALAIREKALGPEDPLVAESLNILAALYRAQGEYAKAEPLYGRALGMVEASASWVVRIEIGKNIETSPAHTQLDEIHNQWLKRIPESCCLCPKLAICKKVGFSANPAAMAKCGGTTSPAHRSSQP